MYAIVDIAGQQFKVEKDQKIFVHRLKAEEGSSVDFDKVLLIDNDSTVIVGSPVIEGALVSAKVLGHLKGDKVIVFKKKNRKGYQKSNGHRQYLSQVVIEDIVEKATKAKPAAEKKAAAPAEKEETASTQAPAAETKPAGEKKATAKAENKETTAKKTAAPKACCR